MLHTVAFTGYRPQKMPINTDYIDLRARTEASILFLIDSGYTHFISGAALGFDSIAADLVLSLRSQHPITLELAIPFPEQATKWNDADRLHWEELCRRADSVTTVSGRYDKGCMFRRNQYMIQNAAILFACYDGQTGGTQMTINLARRMNRQVMLIDPNTRDE